MLKVDTLLSHKKKERTELMMKKNEQHLFVITKECLILICLYEWYIF